MGGAYGNTANAALTFTANGTFPVCLNVSNGSTFCSSSTCQTVNITGVTPTCNISANFSSSQGANGLINFTNLSATTSFSTIYSWNFGNGTTSSAFSPSSTYTSNGTYTVSLLANNTSIASCTSRRSRSLIRRASRSCPHITSGVNNKESFSPSASSREVSGRTQAMFDRTMAPPLSLWFMNSSLESDVKLLQAFLWGFPRTCVTISLPREVLPMVFASIESINTNALSSEDTPSRCCRTSSTSMKLTRRHVNVLWSFMTYLSRPERKILSM